MGEIVAAHLDDARAALEQAGLRILRIDAATEEHVRPRPLRGADFQTFNQQLAQLTEAGLPVESGLRLIAQDMRHRRLAESVRRVADDLEQGLPLADAFERHRTQFPALYSHLIDAGVRSGRLSAVLLNFGRHLDLLQRLRAAMWRSASYPIILLFAIAFVLAFLGMVILPGFAKIFTDFDTQLPALTRGVLVLGQWMPIILLAIGVAVGALLILIAVLRATGRLPWLVDYLLTPLPLIGPVLRLNVVARWCDVLRLGVVAGMDLPAAIELAGQAIGSPRAIRDGNVLRAVMEVGQQPLQTLRMLTIPTTVPATIQFASQQGDLAAVLESLANMYEQLAEARLSVLQTLITPIGVIIIGVFLATICSALFLPLFVLMNSLMK